jgi:hypothetical protein
VGPSQEFSLSEVDISVFYWDSGCSDVSIPLPKSMVLPDIDVRPSLSSLGVQIGHSGFPANADAASSGNNYVALEAGLAIGLLLIVLFVGGSLFWFAALGRAETSDTEAAEFATDLEDPWPGNDISDEADFAIDSHDPWVENQSLISGAYGLVMREDDLFAHVGMVEEGMVDLTPSSSALGL